MNNREFMEDWGLPEASENKKPKVTLNQNTSSPNDEFGTPENNGQQMVDTFLGKMPKNIMPQFQSGTPENKDLLKDTIENVAGIPGMNVIGKAVTKIPDIAKTLFTKVVPRKLVDIVQKGHDTLYNEVKEIYNHVKDKAKNFNINIDGNVINEAEEYLPKTRKVKRLLEDARNGNYEAIHDIQSELGNIGRSGLTSDLPSARREAQEMLDVREKINEGMKNNFILRGKNDLAHILEKGRFRHRTLKETYYDHPGVGRLVEPTMRKIPKKIINFFSEESIPMSKVLNAHPEMKEILSHAQNKEKIIKNLKKTGIGGGIFGASVGAGIGAKSLFDLLLRSSPE